MERRKRGGSACVVGPKTGIERNQAEIGVCRVGDAGKVALSGMGTGELGMPLIRKALAKCLSLLATLCEEGLRKKTVSGLGRVIGQRAALHRRLGCWWDAVADWAKRAV